MIARKLQLGIWLTVGTMLAIVSIAVSPEDSLKCPGDYVSGREYEKALAQHIRALYKTNPDATADDIAQSYIASLIKNDCQGALDHLRDPTTWADILQH